MIDSIIIIGVPQNMSEDEAFEQVKNKINGIME